MTDGRNLVFVILNKQHCFTDTYWRSSSRIRSGMHLEGAAIFVLYARDMTEEKIGILTDLLKPATLETVFASLRPVTMKIQSSDLVIMKRLFSDPRMAVEDIAKETSLSSKTVGRRLEKMRVFKYILYYNSFCFNF